MSDPVSDEYRRRAAEVEKLAETVISDAHLKTIQRIAAQWRELADERDHFWLRRSRSGS